jgi:hypothetical protein
MKEISKNFNKLARNLQLLLLFLALSRERMAVMAMIKDDRVGPGNDDLEKRFVNAGIGSYTLLLNAI